MTEEVLASVPYPVCLEHLGKGLQSYASPCLQLPTLGPSSSAVGGAKLLSYRQHPLEGSNPTPGSDLSKARGGLA